MAKFQVRFDNDVCKGCELCRAVCPKKIIEMSDKFNTKGYAPAAVTKMEECIGCTSCALVCPDGAIEIFKMEEAK